MSHFDFRGRRSRFRREVLSSKSNIGRDPSFSSSRHGVGFAASFKSVPWITNPDYLTQKRPLFVGACSSCTVHSGASLVNLELTSSLPLKNALNPGSNFRLNSDQDTETRANSIMADTSELEAAIIQSEVVKAAKQLNEEEENSSDPLENLKEMKFLPNAGSDLISKVLKIFGKKVLGILFPDGVIYHSGQLEVLSRAQKSGTPLIFINLGQSSLDQAIIRAVLAHHNLALSQSTVSALEKNTFGSPFLKRLFGNVSSFYMFPDVYDNINWSVQQVVFQNIFERGLNLVVSPFSKFYGASESQILDALGHTIELVSTDVISDIQVVPVSLSYDLTLEEITGTETLSFWKLFKVWMGFEPTIGGIVRVDIDQPFSIREFIQTWSQKQDSNLPELRHESTLIEHLKWNVAKLHRFTSVELLSFLLGYKLPDMKRVKMSELEKLFDELRRDLFERKKRDCAFSGSSKDGLAHAIDLLHHYVVKSKCGEWITMISGDSRPFFLEKSRTIVSVYLSEAVVSVAVGSLVRMPLKSYIGTNVKVYVDHDSLSKRCGQLFSLLARDFSIASPCQHFDHGMAKQLLPMLGMVGSMGLNFDLDGIWHTAIVVHNIEWFFGGGGIEHCNPGGTLMGRPLKVEHLGETSLDLDSFRDYLHGLGQQQFRGDRYDLFKHNCNNFSNVVAQFLCGRNIPQYILDLPNLFLNSPIASIIRPIIEQATPHGVTMDSEEQAGSGASYQPPAYSPKKESSTKKDEYIGFTAELSSEKVLSKLRDLNGEEDKAGHQFKDEDLVKIGYLLDRVAMLDVKIWNEVFKPVLTNWPLKDLFPLIDVIRCCSVKTSMPAVVMADIFKLIKERKLVDAESPESVVRLTLRLLSNFFLFENSRAFIRGHADSCIHQVQTLVEMMPSGRDHLEMAATSITFNFALSLKEKPDQDLSFLLTSALSGIFIEKIKNYDALFRVISTLKILIAADVETRDLALALDLKSYLEKMPKLDKKVETAALECINILA